MKILLLNDNPVVNKLVTLSAQKTSDELEIVEDADAISENSYDLLVVDDTIYSDGLMSEVQEKITFTKSLYICSRDAEDMDVFTTIIKKPFLPTDLVELFSSLGKELEREEPIDDVMSDEIVSLDEPNLEELDLDEELELEDDLSLDEIEIEDDSLDLEDDLSLDEIEDDLSLDDLEDDILEEDVTLNVLDKDELQEVQDLLDDEIELDDEVESLQEMSLEEELELDEIENPDDVNLEEELELEEDFVEEELEIEEELADDLQSDKVEILEEVNEEKLADDLLGEEVESLEEANLNDL
ncbi:MAG: DNA topoisomerase IV, partial [Sulfurimonas sp.]|nr:DNA topoisomerase IV [Sulfurimonas sp.]